MSEELILKLGQDTLRTTAMLSGPLLAAALVIGLLVSIFQAVTQINEATLTFIPKMIVVGMVLVIAAPWMLDVMNHFTVQLFEGLTEMVWPVWLEKTGAEAGWRSLWWKRLDQQVKESPQIGRAHV